MVQCGWNGKWQVRQETADNQGANTPFLEQDGKLWFIDEIWPTAHFHIAYELIMVFTYLNGWKSQKKNNISWHMNII